LIGSAQVRRKHAILQHGSILLNQPQQAMAELIAVQTQAKEANTLKTKGDTRHANLFDIAKRQIPIAELEEALKNGFEKNFAVTFRHSQLSEQELRLAHELRPKYLFITRSV
jgi:lipoate-protein ligase A